MNLSIGWRSRRQKNEVSFLVLGLIFILVLLSSLPVMAGNSSGAYYHWSAGRLFWFMVISDTHIGTSGSQDTDYLDWAVREGREVINPLFMVNAGDLTDSTNGGLLPNGPYQEEWDSYYQILDQAGIDDSFYYDIPGNHDAYNDPDLAYYRFNSIQGRATGNHQHSWLREFDFGSYHFFGISTAGNDGAPFSIWPWDNYGDHAGLDADELAYIETELEKYPESELTLVFGHHPFEPGYFAWNDTGLTYGLEPFLDLIEDYNISLYGFGHTHNYRENFYYDRLSRGVFYLNLASLGESDENHYAVMAIDGNGLSVISAQAQEWPVVLITAPVDWGLGDDPNPFACEIPQGRANPVRALVFDVLPVTQVQFSLDETGIWQDMQQVDQGPIWVGFWDAVNSPAGFHVIKVRALGTDTVTDQVKFFVDPSCYIGDSDRDGDMDGVDLAAFLEDCQAEVMVDFASAFGGTGAVTPNIGSMACARWPSNMLLNSDTFQWPTKE